MNRALTMRAASKLFFVAQILLIGATVWAFIRLGQMPCGPDPSHPQVLFGASVLFLPVASAVVVWIRLRRVEGQPGGAAAFATLLTAVLGCALSAGALAFTALNALGC
jgi:hypothetical protein